MAGRISRTFTSALVIVVALLIPIVPFVAFGSWIEPAAAALLRREAGILSIAAVVVGLLSSDIFLPIPSSVVSTYAGQSLGFLGGTVVSWLGMTVGGAIGYTLAARFGPPIARRLAQDEALAEAELLRGAAGIWLVVLTRALPVLAEAAVLVCGLHRIGWQTFFPALALSNLGLALAYAALGNISADFGWFPFALAVSAALPLLIALAVRKRLR